MRRARAIICGLSLAVSIANSCAGQEKSKGADASYDKLLQRLQSDSYEEREEATAAILELGSSIRPWVVRGVASSNLELRLRCEQLLKRIDSSAFARRIAEFRVSGEMKASSDLPCCAEFLSLFGDDERARALYCDIATSERGLLELVADYLRTEREFDIKISEAERRARLSLKTRPIQQTLNDAADIWTGEASTFRPGRAASNLNMRVETLSASMLIANLPGLQEQKGISEAVYGYFRSPANLVAIRKSPHFATIRGGAAKWLRGSEVKVQPLSIAMRLGLSEVAIELGRKAVEAYANDKSADADDAGHAMMTGTTLGIIACGRFGDETDIDRLAQLLNKEVVIQTWITVDQKTSTGQIRDLALAYSAHLAGIDAKELGFPLLEANAETVYAPYSITFLDDAQREATHKEWTKRRGQRQQKFKPSPRQQPRKPDATPPGKSG